MTASLAALAARLLSLLLPSVLPTLPSLGLLLAAVTALAIDDLGWVPYGFLGLPGEWVPMTGGEP